MMSGNSVAQIELKATGVKKWNGDRLITSGAKWHHSEFSHFWLQKTLETAFIAYFMEPSVFLPDLVYIQNFK